MSMSQTAISRAPRPSSLADVLDLILDKGLVIDAYVRVSALGIEVLTIDARVVVASVDTYLRFAEAVNRLDLTSTETKGLPDLTRELREGGSRSEAKGALEGGMEAVHDWRQERKEERQGGGGNGNGRGARRAQASEDQSEERGDRGDRDEAGRSDGDGQGEQADGERQGVFARLAERGRWS
jgi:gas vesicle structural protein